MDRKELTQKRSELIEQRAVCVNEWQALAKLPDNPSTTSMLSAFVLIGAATVLSFLTETPSIYDPQFLIAVILMLVGVGVFFNSKVTIDNRRKKINKLQELVGEINEELKEVSQELGLPFPKIKLPKARKGKK
ncbi:MULTISPECIES: hypothetical protein [unclassified Veillonella]|uniref:hypothetical protein n=1 Tax=unclassified Veillonella TaxID=2630086 RepID=UPI00138A62B5|nr:MULTISPECIES: hypothetical protein [unclassified Veillonella]KAF1682177.1 hypothetical protein VER_06485 [Veillonella sp. R32]